ncbi:MAG: hypothetical protein LBK71_04625, partial [Verrucomicrobiales bacterium]|nr:hypothetical protein [Verrucomicrobiales bacterium]
MNIDYFSPKDLAAKIDKLEQHVDALNETILSLIQDCQEVKHAQQALTLEELRRRFPHPVVGGNIPNWALREQHPFLYTLLNAQKLVSVNDHGTYAVSQSDIIYSFSGRWLQWKLFPILFAIRNKPFFFLEDGFLKNIVTTAANAKENQIDPRYQVSVCYSIDDLTFHFDALRPSRLERMLNSSELTVSGEQQARARRLMQRLVGEKLTKYNHQPVYTPVIGSAGRPKVLVVEQAYQDFSVVRSGANHETFKKMLRDAVTENPGADIIVKLHPDTLVGGWGGNSYYAQV